MTWFTGILVYVVLWWLVFFMSLPIGAQSYHEAGEETQAGNVESAPLKPRVWMKAGASTMIAAVIWGIVYYVIASGMMSFRP